MSRNTLISIAALIVIGNFIAFLVINEPFMLGNSSMPNPHIHEIFRSIDTDRDRMLSKQEWETHHGELFTRLDHDRNQSLNKRELAVPHFGHTRELVESSQIDINVDHYVSGEEWSDFHQERFVGFDKNRDLMISLEEYQQNSQPLKENKR